MRPRPIIPNMLPGEQVLLLLHRHGFVALRFFVIHLLLALVPAAAWVLVGNTAVSLSDSTSPLYALLVLATATYAMLWALTLFVSWLNYYLDVWVVTNERIINITQHRLFHRVVSEQKLFRVQDVTWESRGFIAHVLNFGNVHIQTAAEQGRFTFEHIPHPEHVARTIMQLLEKIENQMGADTMAKLDGEPVPSPSAPPTKPSAVPPQPKQGA